MNAATVLRPITLHVPEAKASFRWVFEATGSGYVLCLVYAICRKGDQFSRKEANAIMLERTEDYFPDLLPNKASNGYPYKIGVRVYESLGEIDRRDLVASLRLIANRMIYLRNHRFTMRGLFGDREHSALWF